MINISNTRSKRLYQQEYHRQMQVLENTFYRELRPILGRQFFNAANLVSHGVTLDGVSHAVNLGRRRLIEVFLKHYKRCSTVFGRKAYNIISESQGKSIKFKTPEDFYDIKSNYEYKTPKDEYWNAINNWSKTTAAQQVRKIQNTTKTQIANVIRKGMEEGEGHIEIAKRIRKTSAKINPYRSKTIALTETHTASVYATDTAVATTRVQMEREWISAKDMRTRRRGKKSSWEHYAKYPLGADGEKVAQDGKFKGTGQALAFPGDPSGAAGNIIRCRCCIIYHTIKRMEPMKPYTPEEMPISSFKPAKTIDKLNEKTDRLNLGQFIFDKDDFKIKDQIKLGNQMNEHFDDLHQKFPKLKKITDKEQKLFDFEFIKGTTLRDTASAGTMGQYEKQYLRIEVASSRKKIHQLKIGKSTHNTGTDLFSVSRHEYGHHMYDNRMVDRREWLTIFKNVGMTNGEINIIKSKKWFAKKISKYAATNSDEAFCESFSAFTSPKYKKGMLPKEIEEYFEKMIGKNK